MLFRSSRTTKVVLSPVPTGQNSTPNLSNIRSFPSDKAFYKFNPSTKSGRNKARTWYLPQLFVRCHSLRDAQRAFRSYPRGPGRWRAPVPGLAADGADRGSDEVTHARS